MPERRQTDDARRRRRGQVAVADNMLGAMIGVAGMAAAVLLYVTMRKEVPLAATTNQVIILAQAVHSIRSSSIGPTGSPGRYKGLQTGDLAALALSPGSTIPRQWYRNGSLINPYGVAIQVLGCETGSCTNVSPTLWPIRFQITMKSVPEGDCRDLASTDFGPDLRGVSVNYGNPVTQPLTLAQGTTLCVPGTNAITWIFR